MELPRSLSSLPSGGAVSGFGRPCATDIWRRCFGVLSGLLAATGARAVELPEDHAEVMFHSYTGGGVTANGPAVLVRKSIADTVSLTGSYYVDAVSNASIDVVTTASPYRETRTEYRLNADYVYRDAQITVGTSTSREPDYTANNLSLDVTQEVFGGMSNVSLGFSRGADDVRKHGAPEFKDQATHWQYRLGVSQILTPRWIMSINGEVLADDGFLGSPYRAARVFGAIVPERNPRTRSARAVKLRLLGDLGHRDSMHVDYRYFWDTWSIKAHTAELGYSRYVGETWLADASLRYYKQDHALFYSDNAATETTYVSRNRQLSSFDSIALGADLSYTLKKVPGKYDFKLNGAYQYVRFNYSDFTDLRTNKPYTSAANVVQLYVTSNF